MKALIFERKSTEKATEISFAFDVDNVKKYLVKNFTGADIYVGFESGVGKNKMVLIPADCSQIIDLSSVGPFRPDILYVLPDETSEKGVEDQCLEW